MSTPWEEASKCPDDATPGRVGDRKPVAGGGQLVTLFCKLTRCPYYADGWIVQVRPDNTIPDKIDPRTREREYAPITFSNTRRDEVLAALERQRKIETLPGAEVSNPYS